MSLLLGLASVFVSDDASKILLITCRNKIFVWEMDGASGVGVGGDGNWWDIVASQEIKMVEDNKELSSHARFSLNQVLVILI